MKQYRKKPLIISAFRWEGQGPDEEALIRRVKAPARDLLAKCSYCNQKLQDHGRLEAAEKSQLVCPGDYIITGVEGEIYACAASVFEKSYEEVEVPNGEEAKS